MWWKLLIQKSVNRTDSYPVCDCKTKTQQPLAGVNLRHWLKIRHKCDHKKPECDISLMSHFHCKYKGAHCTSILMSPFNMRVCLRWDSDSFFVVFKLCTNLMWWVMQRESCPQWKLQYCTGPTYTSALSLHSFTFIFGFSHANSVPFGLTIH